MIANTTRSRVAFVVGGAMLLALGASFFAADISAQTTISQRSETIRQEVRTMLDGSREVRDDYLRKVEELRSAEQQEGGATGESAEQFRTITEERRAEMEQIRAEFISKMETIREEYRAIAEEYKEARGEFESNPSQQNRQEMEERRALFMEARAERFQDRCEGLTQNMNVPQGYGAPWDVASGTGEMSVSIRCDSATSDLAFDVGNGRDNQYVYRYGYVWDGDQWQQFELDGEDQVTDIWFRGEGNADVELPPEALEEHNYLVGYICTWEDNRWKCGCRDESCNDDENWQLQVAPPQEPPAAPPAL